ncbi:prepilin-type N-terminal cleavage/methylation domain-containing protein [Rubritalea spongiae]|uniref:Prepilin-type N-terminal cleavage/methylation domain-containing protein n=1 Tax=Rubritalea spongiae TaxID=430797 RepID=A0ABW5EB08_9BACT
MKLPTTIRNGFTLLETILAMAILATIMSVIFAITHSSIGLSQTIIGVQAQSRQQAALRDYLQEVLTNIPSEARVTLFENDFQLMTLMIENPNTEFPSNGRQQVAKQLWLSGAKDRDGLVSLVLEISNQFEDEASTTEPSYYRAELINQLAYIRWDFYNPSRDEWSPEWTPEMGRPTQIKFYYSFPDYPEEHMLYFWIPNRTPPAQQTGNNNQSPQIPNQ